MRKFEKKYRVFSSNPRNSCGKGKRGCSVTIILPYMAKKKKKTKVKYEFA